MPDRRQLIVACAAGGWMSTCPAETGWPDSQVTLVVPFPAGGPADTVARNLAEALARRWKQPVLVDNKAGAGGVIGTAAVARAKPDGHTLGIAISAHPINQTLRAGQLPFDVLRDFSYITMIAKQHVALVARPSLGVDSVTAMLALARRSPGTLSYGSPGIGTSAHLAGELLKRDAGVEMTHIPFKGSAPAVTELLAGRLDLLFDVAHSIAPYVQQGRMTLLAYAGDVPKNAPNAVVMSSIVPGYWAGSVMGLLAPRGVAPERVDLIRQAVAEVLAAGPAGEALTRMGLEIIASTPAEYKQHIEQEVSKWGRLIREKGIRAE